MTINATLINLYHVCKREMWLHANGIRMEHTSEIVADGKLIGETTYPQRPEKYTEIEVGGSKIDFYDARNKVIHEVKRSNSVEMAHEWQVKYYIWLLTQAGIEGVTGIIEYPKLRHTSHVILTGEDINYLKEAVNNITALVHNNACPRPIRSKICQSCSYYDFCYIAEPEA